MMLIIKKEYSDYVTKTFRLPREIIDQLEALAQTYNTSLNKVVIQSLEYALDSLRDKETPES